jgi:predicted transcriptional regulator
MKTLSFKIPPALDRGLEALARQRSMGKSELVRQAIEDYLAAGSLPAAGSFLARAASLAGCVEGPPDLASNPDHLRGFGE